MLKERCRRRSCCCCAVECCHNDKAVVWEVGLSLPVVWSALGFFVKNVASPLSLVERPLGCIRQKHYILKKRDTSKNIPLFRWKFCTLTFKRHSKKCTAFSIEVPRFNICTMFCTLHFKKRGTSKNVPLFRLKFCTLNLKKRDTPKMYPFFDRSAATLQNMYRFFDWSAAF